VEPQVKNEDTETWWEVNIFAPSSSGPNPT
jgi:hypothetical protein